MSINTKTRLTILASVVALAAAPAAFAQGAASPVPDGGTPSSSTGSSKVPLKEKKAQTSTGTAFPAASPVPDGGTPSPSTGSSKVPLKERKGAPGAGTTAPIASPVPDGGPMKATDVGEPKPKKAKVKKVKKARAAPTVPDAQQPGLQPSSTPKL